MRLGLGRGLWFVAGAGAGIYAVNRARRVAEAFTPDGLRDRASGLAAASRVFAHEVATGRQERETQLREQLGLLPDRGIEHYRGALPPGSDERGVS
jgi:hypothetical protein